MQSLKATANSLPRVARDLLIEHIDGPSFINVPVVAGDRVASRASLLDRKLIRYNSNSDRPTGTVITENGRYVLAIILAHYAETLIRAGYGVAAEMDSAIRDDAIVLFEQHVKSLQPSSDLSGAPPSPATASAPEPAVHSPSQIVEHVGG